jgi:hypothetical protein
MVKVASMAAMKQRQAVFLDQKEQACIKNSAHLTAYHLHCLSKADTWRPN